jgi:hypothetical protein
LEPIYGYLPVLSRVNIIARSCQLVSDNLPQVRVIINEKDRICHEGEEMCICTGHSSQYLRQNQQAGNGYLQLHQLIVNVRRIFPATFFRGSSLETSINIIAPLSAGVVRFPDFAGIQSDLCISLHADF